MRFDHYFHSDQTTAERLVRIERMLGRVLENQEIIMATMDDLKAAVAAETTEEQSVIALLTGLAQQLQAAKNNNDPAALQGVIDHINANTAAMAAAVTANTPASPAAPAPPTS